MSWRSAGWCTRGETEGLRKKGDLAEFYLGPGSSREQMREDGVFRIAVDIGGTFADCMVLDDRGRRLTTKALTMPEDPAERVVDCLQLAAAALGADVHQM